jgi:hypothetical protein
VCAALPVRGSACGPYFCSTRGRFRVIVWTSIYGLFQSSQVVTKVQNPDEYIEIAEVFVQYLLINFGVSF